MLGRPMKVGLLVYLQIDVVRLSDWQQHFDDCADLPLMLCWLYPREGRPVLIGCFRLEVAPAIESLLRACC